MEHGSMSHRIFLRPTLSCDDHNGFASFANRHPQLHPAPLQCMSAPHHWSAYASPPARTITTDVCLSLLREKKPQLHAMKNTTMPHPA